MTTAVHLGGPPLQWVDEVEYLVLRLRREVFLYKNPADVENKCKSALHLLTSEDWFTLDIEPRHIVAEFNSRVRSQMLYGSELLTYKARKTFVNADKRVVNLFITNLLKLGKERPLHQKHQTRCHLALGIESFDITVDKLINGMIQTLLTRRDRKNTKVAIRANKSLLDTLKLGANHPMRIALAIVRPTHQVQTDRRLTAWRAMEVRSRGQKTNLVDRQLKSSNTVQGKEDNSQKESFIETPDLNGEPRRAALRLGIYRFPIKYSPTPFEANKLAWI